MSQPSDNIKFPDFEGFSYISEKYFDYILREKEDIKISSAFDILLVPILYNTNNEELINILNNLNGVMLPGGFTNLKEKRTDLSDSGMGNWQLTPYGLTIQFIVEYGLKKFENNETFPIFGICLGFEGIALVI